MYRFFVEESQIYDGTVHITGSDVNHIKNVLRMRPGEKILVSTGGEKEYHCAVSDFPEGEVLAAVEEVTAADRELPSGIVLFQGLPKGDKMELIIQKAVELGATEIVPVEMKRCVVKLDRKKAEKKAERWQTIALGAAKQSLKVTAQIIDSVHPHDRKDIFHNRASFVNIKNDDREALIRFIFEEERKRMQLERRM